MGRGWLSREVMRHLPAHRNRMLIMRQCSKKDHGLTSVVLFCFLSITETVVFAFAPNFNR